MLFTHCRNFNNSRIRLHGKPMSYESYCNLLLSAASTYDAQFAPKSRSDCLVANLLQE